MNGYKNIEIVCNELVNHKIYTVKEITRMLENGEDIPVHTYDVWKKLGFQVKKGEKATIKTRLWKHNVKMEDKVDEDGNIIPARPFYLAPAYLFLASQVEAIDKAKQTLANQKTEKAEEPKAEKKADPKKAKTNKAEPKKTETKKAKTNKAEPKKTETKKAKSKTQKTKKAEPKKAKSVKKADKTVAKSTSKKANTKLAKSNVNDGLTMTQTQFDVKNEANQIVNMIRFEAKDKLGNIVRSIQMPFETYLSKDKAFKNSLKKLWGIE